MTTFKFNNDGHNLHLFGDKSVLNYKNQIITWHCWKKKFEILIFYWEDKNKKMYKK